MIVCVRGHSLGLWLRAVAEMDCSTLFTVTVDVHYLKPGWEDNPIASDNV